MGACGPGWGPVPAPASPATWQSALCLCSASPPHLGVLRDLDSAVHSDPGGLREGFCVGSVNHAFIQQMFTWGCGGDGCGPDGEGPCSGRHTAWC